MGVDAECRKCGRVVSSSSLRDGTHKCDETEAMSELRDRIYELENAAGLGGRGHIEAIAYATAALGYAAAGKTDSFDRCMNSAVRAAPFNWDFEPTLRISIYEMTEKAAKLLEAIGDEL